MTAEDVLAGALWFTNDYIATEHGESNMFITLFYGVLEPADRRAELHQRRAQPAADLAVGGGPVRELESSALPLGIVAGQVYEIAQHHAGARRACWLASATASPRP